jgi:hypothetical protein
MTMTLRHVLLKAGLVGLLCSAGHAALASAIRVCTKQIQAATIYACSAGTTTAYTFELDNALNQNPSVFQIFDDAPTTPTLGMTTPKAAIAVPAGVVSIVTIPAGWAFSTQISIACTTGYRNNSVPINPCGYTVWATP